MFGTINTDTSLVIPNAVFIRSILFYGCYRERHSMLLQKMSQRTIRSIDVATRTFLKVDVVIGTMRCVIIVQILCIGYL